MSDLFTLAAMGTAALSGLIGNRVDHLVCRQAKAVWHALRDGQTEPRNGDLARSIRRAQLMALRLGVKAYKDLPHPGWRSNPGYSQEDITTPLLVWIDRALIFNEAPSSDDEQKRRVEDRIERVLIQPAPHDGPSARRQDELRDIALDWTLEEARALAPRAPDWARFDALIRNGREPDRGSFPGWWPLFRAFLAEEVKRDEKVQRILAEQGIARLLELQVDLAAAVAELQGGFEHAFEDMQDALDELREACHEIQGSSSRIEAAVIRLDQAIDLALPTLARIEAQVQGIPSSVQEIVDASNRAWYGIRLETGRCEPTNERVQIRPSELLLPRYRIAPFVDREGLLSSILSWVTLSSERRATGRLYVAPGGFGKTRLGIELLIRLESLGWRCGFISKAHGGFSAPGALLDIMAAAGAVGVCVVVDYAESLIRELGELADSALASGSVGPPIRVVAFARSPEGWWASFAGDASPSAVFDPTPFSAISEQLSAQDRSEIFAQSRAAFVDKLRAVGLPYREQGQPPNLAVADRPLLVVAIAFLDAIGVDSRGRSVFQTLYEEERRQWRRVLQVEADDEVADLARAVAQVTLVQGTTVDGAAALMRADDTDRSIPRPKILISLRRLYGVPAIQDNPATPEGEDIPFISPLEPDLLGEHVCIEVLQESDPALLSSTLSATLIGPPFFRDDTERILAVLVRSTHPNHDPRIRRGAQHAIAHLSTLVPQLAAFQVGHLANSLPPRSVALSEFAVVVARRLVDVAPQDTSEAALKQRADTQAYLSARLSDRGYHEDALAAGEEAVKLHRQLAAMNRKDSLLGLASALHLHSQNLIQLGRRRDAVAPSEEAVELDRELAESSPETLGPGLAESLRNLGETYASVGRKDEALEASKDACARFEVLAGENPDRFLPALAGALNSLSNRLFQAGQSDKALEATSKAVEIDRQLVAKNRDAYLPGLAAALNNLGRDLQNRNRVNEALAVILEAIE